MLTRKEAITKENKSYKERIKRLDKFFDFMERHGIRHVGNEFIIKNDFYEVTKIDWKNYEIRTTKNGTWAIKTFPV